MTTAYLYPPNGQPGKSQALTAVSGIAFTGNYNTTDTYTLNVVSGAVSNSVKTGATYGTTSVAADTVNDLFWGSTAFQYVYSETEGGAVQVYDILSIIALQNDGNALVVSEASDYPTSDAGLLDGDLWSNGGIVSVYGTTTPSAAPPVYYGQITAAALLALTGSNLPLTAPGNNMGQLWNNGGIVSIDYNTPQYELDTFFFTGTSVVSGSPYFVDYGGHLLNVVSGSANILANMNTTTGLSYDATLNSLYSINASGSAIGVYSLASGSATTYPVPTSNNIRVLGSTAGSGLAAVYGVSKNNLLSSYVSNNVAFNAANTAGAFVNPNNNTINLLSGVDPTYSVVNTFMCSGTGFWCSWNTIDTQVLVTNNANNFVTIYAVENSAFSVFQTLNVTDTGATKIIKVGSTEQVAYCNPSHNYVNFLAFSGTWSVAQTLALANPSCLSTYDGVTIAAGVTNAVDFLTVVSNQWAVTSSVPLSYTPSDIFQDAYGNTIAVGYTGSYPSYTGYLSIITAGVARTISFSGNPTSVYASLDQILISVGSAGEIQSYSYLIGGNPVLTSSVPADISATASYSDITSTGQGIFVSDLMLSQYYWRTPYSIDLVPYGWLTTYNPNTNTWGATLYLNIAFSTPSAVAWGVDGNMYMAASNVLYEVNTAGSVLNSTNITTYQGQVSSTLPVGVSDLQWMPDGHLYGTTSLNSALLRIL